MNWYKKSKLKNHDNNVLDTQLLCCGYPENRREKGKEWDKKSQTNFPVENQEVKTDHKEVKNDKCKRSDARVV